MQRLIAITLVCLIGLTGVGPARAEKDEDTPKAAKTRKLLKTKISLDIKDVPLREVMDEIRDDHVKGVNIIVDTKGGVSQNQKLSFSGKDVTLEDALDKMFAKNDLGYYVISKKGDAYDGAIKIVKGKSRGYLKP